MKKLLIYAFLLIIILIVKCYSSDNSNNSNIRVGVFGAYNLFAHNVNFKKFFTIPSCCSGFSDIKTSSMSFAPTISCKFSDLYEVEFKLSYFTIPGVFRAVENETFIKDGKTLNGEFTYYLNTYINYISTEISLDRILFNNLRIKVGTMIIILFNNNFHQYEQITKPANGVTFLDSLGFDTYKRVRNEYLGSIPNINNIGINLMLGADYLVPLNSENTFFLAPEITYAYSLSDVVKNITWKINYLRVGLSFSYLIN